MKIVLIGAPGSGKGTQSALVSEKLGLPHISTGDIFRDIIKSGTEVGLKIKAIIDGGDLCPDELTIKIVNDRLKAPDCKDGYVLDGFPRNVKQAKALDEKNAPDKVIELVIPPEIIERRITGRRVCSKCKNSFHVDGIGDTKTCPDCGGELVIRGDDNVDSVKERLKVYKTQTAPIIDYYRSQGKLKTINADLSVGEVFDSIVKVIK